MVSRGSDKASRSTRAKRMLAPSDAYRFTVDSRRVPHPARRALAPRASLMVSDVIAFGGLVHESRSERCERIDVI
jgi:hypothetical protein